MVSSVLIANRGEIACRIIRTARDLGYRTIAVFSDADAAALHVRMADQAVRLGPAPARESYLLGDAIIEAARRTGADAIHPGYGFLSENAGFAEKCAENGLVFIGPPPSAIRAMGGKSTAKALMDDAGVPLLPGYHGEAQDTELLVGEARTVGFPVMIKASAGGGGKGMRVVRDEESFRPALDGARREALAAFGDDRVLIERYLDRPRHVEVQVFADRHGACIHLLERDCSLQRRHQKVIEEAPAPNLPDDVRRSMGEAAVAAARAIGYVGAGTVEFLYAPDTQEFFFMEMNTRLQVEHPVTEAVTGIDLVEWQFRIADGEALPVGQEAITANGHAVEARLYAEDPDNGFLPSTGTLSHLRLPTGQPGIRVDSGVETGDVISVHYDPMIAKIIAHGRDRQTALRRLARALSMTEVVGPVTNTAFLRRLVAHPAFEAAEIETGFIDRYSTDLLTGDRRPDETVLSAAVAGVLAAREQSAVARAAQSADRWSPWGHSNGWRLNDDGSEILSFRYVDDIVRLTLRYLRDGGYRIGYASDQTIPDVQEGDVRKAVEKHLDFRVLPDGALTVGLDGDWRQMRVVRVGLEVTVMDGGDIWRLSLIDPIAEADRDAAGGKLTAPMPGRLVAVFVSKGQRVSKGDALVVLEAMKMEHTIVAPADGVVAHAPFSVGDQVEEGVELVVFDDADE